MLDELDFTREAQSLIEFRDFLARNNIIDATAPLPYTEVSSKRVLTMEYLRGVPFVNANVKDFTSDTAATLFTAISTWGRSIADMNFFHADLHGGNLLCLEDGRVGFLDFGIVGRIPSAIVAPLGALVQAGVNGDYPGVTRALVLIGATDGPVDEAKLGRELEEVVNKLMVMAPDPTNAEKTVAMDDREITKLVLEVVGVAENNGLKLPREFGLLMKQVLFFDRYQKLLAPDSDPLRDPRLRDYLNSEMGTPTTVKESLAIEMETPAVE
jgi:aarF domain-containing kinase